MIVNNRLIGNDEIAILNEQQTWTEAVHESRETLDKMH
jgi:hypothetical protein